MHKVITNDKIKDLLTGEEFIPRKSSQKFACSENRIKYNNLKAKRFRLSRAYIEGPQINNLKILKELLVDKKEGHFHKQFLEGKGYNFCITTHMDKYETIDYPCIYEFMIISLGNDYVKIRKND